MNHIKNLVIKKFYSFRKSDQLLKYPNTTQGPKNNEYWIWIPLFSPTIGIVFKYRIICHNLLLTPPLSTLDWFQIQKSPNYSWTRNVVKIVVTFELIMQFWCPSRFTILRTIGNHFILWRKTINLILWPLSTITTFVTHIHTYIHTDGHGDFMTNPAQRAFVLCHPVTKSKSHRVRPSPC